MLVLFFLDSDIFPQFEPPLNILPEQINFPEAHLQASEESISLKGYVEFYSALPSVYRRFSLKTIATIYKIKYSRLVKRPPPPPRNHQKFTLVVLKQYMSFPPSIDSPLNPYFSFLSYIWNISFLV